MQYPKNDVNNRMTVIEQRAVARSAWPIATAVGAMLLGFVALSQLVTPLAADPGLPTSLPRGLRLVATYEIAATGAFTPTNEWVNFYSQASYYYGQPLPVGAVVRAFNPRGVQAGEFVVTDRGWYGLMPVYRDDPDTPEDEGLRPGEEVSFTINRISARPDGPDDAIWTTNGALKQVNLIASSVKPTNEWVNFYSQNTILNGQPVPVGTLIEAFDPQGTKCGETIVNHAGWYGLLPCYRDDPDTSEDEGAVPGDTIAFRIAGSPATASGPDAPQWTSNGDIREVDLVASCVLFGDLDSDGDVDVADILLVASRWRTSCANPDPDNNPDTPNYEARYDLDHDCDIDIVDIMLVSAHWGETCR